MSTARLYSNGSEIRVDLENTKERWPNCRNEHKGFTFLTFGFNAIIKATEYALNNGATKVIYNDNKIQLTIIVNEAQDVSFEHITIKHNDNA